LKFRQIRPGTFSPEGFQRLKDRIAEFIGELVVESIRVSKRYQSDSVSPAYVDRAAEHLASGKPAMWRRLVGGIGGLVAGVGLATAGSMIQQNAYTTRGMILSLVCIVIGLPAFVLHVMKE
jgi:hypothetical protein